MDIFKVVIHELVLFYRTARKLMNSASPLQKAKAQPNAVAESVILQLILHCSMRQYRKSEAWEFGCSIPEQIYSKDVTVCIGIAPSSDGRKVLEPMGDEEGYRTMVGILR